MGYMFRVGEKAKGSTVDIVNNFGNILDSESEEPLPVLREYEERQSISAVMEAGGEYTAISPQAPSVAGTSDDDSRQSGQ
jgi:hypothetical protein